MTLGGFLEEKKTLAVGKKEEETEAPRGLGPHSKSAEGVKCDRPALSQLLCLVSGPWYSEDCSQLCGK